MMMQKYTSREKNTNEINRPNNEKIDNCISHGALSTECIKYTVA